MPTVYLSIGTPKTGTTAIQTFLRENEAFLNQQGYCFPDFTLEIGNGGYRDRNGHFLIYNEGNEIQYDEDEIREEGFRAIGKLAKKYPNIILSDEELWKGSGKRSGFWADAKKGFEKIGCRLKVIVYLRRQDLFIQSLWNQNVKSKLVRRTESFEECMANNLFSYFPLDYYEHLCGIAECVDKQDIIVRPYERGQFEGTDHSIFSDFLQCIGLTLTDGYTRETVKRNPGLRGNFTEIKRIMNSVPEYREMDDFLADSVRLASNCMAQEGLHSDTSMFASYEQQKEFLQRYEETNRKTAEVFLDRPDGRLFYDSVEELPVWKLEENLMYRDIILAGVEIICRQERQIRKLRQDMEKENLASRVVRKVGNFIKNK